jgi:hypothetical protein
MVEASRELGRGGCCTCFAMLYVWTAAACCNAVQQSAAYVEGRVALT